MFFGPTQLVKVDAFSQKFAGLESEYHLYYMLVEPHVCTTVQQQIPKAAMTPICKCLRSGSPGVMRRHASTRLSTQRNLTCDDFNRLVLLSHVPRRIPYSRAGFPYQPQNPLVRVVSTGGGDRDRVVLGGACRTRPRDRSRWLVDRLARAAQGAVCLQLCVGTCVCHAVYGHSAVCALFR